MLDITNQNIIDIFSAMGGADFKYPSYFCDINDINSCCDGVHSVDAGYKVLVETVYETLFERINEN